MAREAKAVLAENLAAVRSRIARAAERSGRTGAAVRLVAVTKTVSAGTTAALVGLGARDLGENRIEALLAKRDALGPAAAEVRWHMIGHLQRNKIARFLDAGALLHSLDSERLADALEERLGRAAPGGASAPLQALVEVNVSGEASKGGLRPDELGSFLERLEARGRRIRVTGLMTMAPLLPDPEAARPVFRSLRQLRDRERERRPHLAELSMGMTNDFEVAIEEGATIVRVGTALFSGMEEGS